MVQFEGVQKRFGEVVAVKHASFTIETGGVVGLLGPNGAGKTTTMRIMTGFLEPTAGAVHFEGRPFSPSAVDMKRRIGYLPESAPGYGEMIAFDYLVYEARVHGLDWTSRVPEVVRMVGLQEHAHKPIRTLSKGYRQRVGLAHTLLHDPSLLVLDEPTSGLDPNQIVEVRSLIKRISETKTVVLSTHIMQEVEALCDRVIVIDHGTIRFDGSISEFDKGARQRQVRLSVAGGSQTQVVQAFQRVEGVVSVENVRKGEQTVDLVVVSESTHDVRPLLFSAAVDNGFTLYEIARERTSAEQAFHHLTNTNKTEEQADE